MVIYGGHGGGPGDTWALDFGSFHPPSMHQFSPTAGAGWRPGHDSGHLASRCHRCPVQWHSAPILTASFDSIATRVPAGATTGPITVTTLYGSASSGGNFFVGEPPEIDSFSPSGGKVGTMRYNQGNTSPERQAFASGLAAHMGTAGRTSSLIPMSKSPPVACCTRGPISVTNPVGTAVSTLDFDLISGVTVRADGSGDAPTVQAGH